ncbi:MAG: enoyl-CoA hydratase/isomerase family protein [Gammaproteobacteria bacterium]|nr:enoyl-CoA hydratase/isomerase family protein [Gammaproteobacteria bacterium]
MSEATFETIQLDYKGPIAILTLNRPDRLNAIGTQMKLDLTTALDRVEADDRIKVLILRGAGRAFCAGFDLKEETEVKATDVAHWRPELQRDFDAIMRFWYFRKPTISAVHKYALAGGFEMAIACDITVAAEGTRLGEPELKFGSGIVALLLPWLTNPKKAKELILTGNDRLDAKEALALGIVNRVVPAGEEFETAMTIARDIATMDMHSVQMTKEAINRTYEIMVMGQSLRLALDVDTQIESLETPERKTFSDISKKEGLKAAIAWRDARFSEGL